MRTADPSKAAGAVKSGSKPAKVRIPRRRARFKSMDVPPWLDPDHRISQAMSVLIAILALWAATFVSIELASPPEAHIVRVLRETPEKLLVPEELTAVELIQPDPVKKVVEVPLPKEDDKPDQKKDDTPRNEREDALLPELVAPDLPKRPVTPTKPIGQSPASGEAPVKGGGPKDPSVGDGGGSSGRGSEGPVFFGAKIEGNVVLVLDRSASMRERYTGAESVVDAAGVRIAAPSRMDAMRSEAAQLLRGLEKTQRFAIVSFGGDPEHEAQKALLEATKENIDEAVKLVFELKPNGATPTYGALKIACNRYEFPDLKAGSAIANTIVLLTDGEPNVDSTAPEADSSPATVLKMFKQWFAPLKAKKVQFLAVGIGLQQDLSGNCRKFLAGLVEIAGGRLVER